MATTGRLHAFRFGVFVFSLIVSGMIAISSTSPALAVNANDSKYSPPSLEKAKSFGDDFCYDWDTYKGGGLVGDMVWITARGGGVDIYAYAGATWAPVSVNAGGKYCSLHNSSTQVYGHYYDDLGTIVNNNTTRYPRIAYPKGAAGTYFSTAKDSWINISGLDAGDHTLCITLDTVYGTRTPEPSPNACSLIKLHILQRWTINGQSYIRKSTDVNNSRGTIRNVTPGTRLYWSHDLRSSAAMEKNITYQVDKSGFSNGWNDTVNPTASASGGANELFVKIYPTGGAYTVYGVTQDDVGNTLCQRISWTPKSWSDSGRGYAQFNACAEVPYNFNLTPSIDPLGQDVGDQGGTIPTVTAKVANSGPTKSYRGIDWQFSKIIVKPGGSIETGRQVDDTQNGCAYYRNDCTSTNGRGSPDDFFNVGSTVVHQLLNEQIGDLEVGTRICYGLSMKAYRPGLNNNSPNWRHSPARCVVVGKKPKVQIWGGDLSVGRRFASDTSAITGANVETSTSIKDNRTKTFGSWVEYGIFAPSTILGTGSAAGLAGQDGNSSSAQKDWSRLTFANGGHTPAGSCGGFGCFAQAGGMGTIPDVASRLAPKATTSTPQLNGSVSLDGRNDTYYVNGNLTVAGGTIQKGNSVVIKASGVVRIGGDIKYTGDTLSTISDIPQVVIIANQIIIEENVTNVDAWLIANGVSGSVFTCGDLKAILTSKICDKRLTVNGPVMAKKLYLQRTAGSGTDTASGEPAEVLNLRTDAYLWAINKAGGQGAVRTLKTTELAPRF